MISERIKIYFSRERAFEREIVDFVYGHPMSSVSLKSAPFDE